jgi:hypothetical protein
VYGPKTQKKLKRKEKAKEEATFFIQIFWQRFRNKKVAAALRDLRDWKPQTHPPTDFRSWSHGLWDT